MAVKRIFTRGSKKYGTCLRCGRPIEERLRDDTVYTCGGCGQQHYVDVYGSRVALTVAERPEIRRRQEDRTSQQQAARRALISRAEEREREKREKLREETAQAEASGIHAAKYAEWLRELAQMQPEELEKEYGYMDDDMRQQVEEEVEKIRREG